MQRLFLLVAVMLLSGCLTAPPKEAARPTLMPRAQSYKDLTHLPAPTGKIFVSVYNIQDETGQFKRKRLARTVLIFTEKSDQLSRATDRVPGLPASPGYAQ